MIRSTIFVDLETTGVNLQQDEIVEIGIIYYDAEGNRYEYGSLVKPTILIPAQATSVHRISNEDVKDAPKFADIHNELLPWFRDAKYFCAYNFRFDFSIIQKAFSDIGIDLPSSKYIFIDPCAIFKKKVPHTLASAYRFYLGSEMKNAHRALDDIKATEEVLIAQAKEYRDSFMQGLDKLQLETIGDTSIVSNWFIKTDRGYEFSKGKHQGQVVSKGHSGYLSWMSDQDSITVDDKRIMSEAINGSPKKDTK